MFQTAKSVLRRDPAANSLMEVVLTYPGIRALFWYRIAHFLNGIKLFTLAGLLSQHAVKTTGISIAPAARIGKRVFIDHGVGVVIGSTAIVEDDVTIMHGVTLGARRIQTGIRHPHVRHGAFLGANAQILGNIMIGADSKVGANAVVLQSVPDKATAVGNPAKIVNQPDQKILKIDFVSQNKIFK